jgi:hypothetical protein
MYEAERLAVVPGDGVRVRETREELGAHGDSDRGSQRRLVLQETRQGDAIHMLHHDEVRAVALAEVEDGDDVLVMEASREPRFVEKHGAEALVVHDVGEHALDGHALAKLLRPLRDGERSNNNAIEANARRGPARRTRCHSA